MCEDVFVLKVHTCVWLTLQCPFIGWVIRGLVEKNVDVIGVKAFVIFYMIFSLLLHKDVYCISNYNLITGTEFPHFLSLWGCLYVEEITKLTSENYVQAMYTRGRGGFQGPVNGTPNLWYRRKVMSYNFRVWNQTISEPRVSLGETGGRR